MRKASFADMHCSIAQSLEILGERWTLLILRDAFLDVRRFDDFVQRLGIARNVLTNRLDTLVDAGLLRRQPYDEARGRCLDRPEVGACIACRRTPPSRAARPSGRSR